MSFCLKSCRALGFCSYTSAFSPVISRCRWKVLHLLIETGDYHPSFSRVREQHYLRMSGMEDSSYTSLVQPLYTLVTRQCKCRLIWPPVSTVEPVPCVKSSLEVGKCCNTFSGGWCLKQNVIRKKKWFCYSVPVTISVFMSNFFSLICSFRLP